MSAVTFRTPMAVLAVVGVVAACAPAAHAQPWVTYDASLGTFPAPQCWDETLDTIPALLPDAYEIVGGDLHVSTLSWPAAGAEGGALYWQRSDVPLDFADGAVIEIRVRVASAPNRAINPDTGWPRPGFAISVQDAPGRAYWAGFGSGRVFLSNDFFGQYDTPGTVDLAFDTTDGHHVYRIEAGPAGAVLKIDGVTRLGPIAPGAASSPSANGRVYFGDPTYWANSETFTSWFRVSGESVGLLDGLSGPDSVRACPAGAASFGVVADGVGPFDYQWQAEAPAGSGSWEDLADGLSALYGTVAGAATDTLALSGFGPGAATNYRVVVTTKCGSVSSVAAELLICRADYTCDGIVNSTDVSEFINQWFTDLVNGTLITDIDGNGVVNSTDVSEFINRWFDDIARGCGS